MRFYLISENWLISSTARKAYRWSGGISITLLPTIFAVRLLHQLDLLSPGLIFALRGMLMISVLATAVTYVAMQYFLLVEDESPAWKQILWFLAMVLLGIGPGLYVFFGYSRSEYFRANKSNGTES